MGDSFLLLIYAVFYISFPLAAWRDYRQM